MRMRTEEKPNKKMEAYKKKKGNLRLGWGPRPSFSFIFGVRLSVFFFFSNFLSGL